MWIIALWLWFWFLSKKSKAKYIHSINCETNVQNEYEVMLIEAIFFTFSPFAKQTKHINESFEMSKQKDYENQRQVN